MKKFFVIASLFIVSAPLYTLASQAGPYIKHEYQPSGLPRLQYGLLTLHNMLSEPINYSLETYINAEDPERQVTIRNGDKKAKTSGMISAQTTQAIRTYPHAVLDKQTQIPLPIFGGYVLLKLKQQAQNGTEYNGRIDAPGAYAMSLDQSGNLTLNKQLSEAETKAKE